MLATASPTTSNKQTCYRSAMVGCCKIPTGRLHWPKFYPSESHMCIPDTRVWKNATASARTTHYSDVIMGAMASQMTNLTIVYSTVYTGADQRKHESSASLAFVRGIHRWPVNSPHKWPVTRKNISIWWRHHGLKKRCPGTGCRIFFTEAAKHV